MSHKLPISILALAGALMLAEGSVSTSYATPASKPAQVQVTLNIERGSISGGERTTGKIGVKRNGNTQELKFRLENSNPSVVRFATSEITLKPGESEAVFGILTTATPIRTDVIIRAFLQPSDQAQVHGVIHLVPAVLKAVTVSQPTLNGTHGSKITCRVELNANAPTGGIALSLNWSAGYRARVDIPNPRVEAGNKEVTFEIPYDEIEIENISVGRGDRPEVPSGFNSQTSRVDLVVSLEAQIDKPEPGIASKVTFDVIPLRVASIAVQPTSVTGGAEAVATFTLNFPAGRGEAVWLDPLSTVGAWARPLGSSCQGNIPLVPMPLAEGATSHSFKVCTTSVTAVTTRTVRVLMRSGSFPLPITVQP